jgi:hypothetical protein
MNGKGWERTGSCKLKCQHLPAVRRIRTNLRLSVLGFEAGTFWALWSANQSATKSVIYFFCTNPLEPLLNAYVTAYILGLPQY